MKENGAMFQACDETRLLLTMAFSTVTKERYVILTYLTQATSSNMYAQVLH